MFGKKCAGKYPDHRWGKKTYQVSPGTFQRVCVRCGRVQNVKCGTWYSPHKFKRDKRSRANRIRCKRCGYSRVL